MIIHSYSLLFLHYCAKNFNRNRMFFLIFWSDSETFNYNYILVLETLPWRWQGYWPKHVGEDINKNTSNSSAFVGCW